MCPAAQVGSLGRALRERSVLVLSSPALEQMTLLCITALAVDCVPHTSMSFGLLISDVPEPRPSHPGASDCPETVVRTCRRLVSSRPAPRQKVLRGSSSTTSGHIAILHIPQEVLVRVTPGYEHPPRPGPRCVPLHVGTPANPSWAETRKHTRVMMATGFVSREPWRRASARVSRRRTSTGAEAAVNWERAVCELTDFGDRYIDAAQL